MTFILWYLFIGAIVAALNSLWQYILTPDFLKHYTGVDIGKLIIGTILWPLIIFSWFFS